MLTRAEIEERLRQYEERGGPIWYEEALLTAKQLGEWLQTLNGFTMEVGDLPAAKWRQADREARAWLEGSK